MKNFILYTVTAGYRDESKFEIVKGFDEAEKKAKELFKEAWKNYPGPDTYVDCVEHDYELNETHLVLVCDYNGELYWRKMVFSDLGLCPLYARFLDEDEEEKLKEWRNEKDRSVYDLSEDELKALRGQICAGSMYLSDYDNSFNVDTNELSSECECYLDWLEDEGINDSPEEFAYYIKNVA